jgi:hypothetical protein
MLEYDNQQVIEEWLKLRKDVEVQKVFQNISFYLLKKRKSF